VDELEDALGERGLAPEDRVQPVLVVEDGGVGVQRVVDLRVDEQGSVRLWTLMAISIAWSARLYSSFASPS